MLQTQLISLTTLFPNIAKVWYLILVLLKLCDQPSIDSDSYKSSFNTCKCLYTDLDVYGKIKEGIQNRLYFLLIKWRRINSYSSCLTSWSTYVVALTLCDQPSVNHNHLKGLSYMSVFNSVSVAIKPLEELKIEIRLELLHCYLYNLSFDFKITLQSCFTLNTNTINFYTSFQRPTSPLPSIYMHPNAHFILIEITQI